MTVGQDIADLYRRNFGLSAEVVMNAPGRVDLEFRPVEPTQISLIYHGVANPRRELDKLVEMAGLLDDRYTLHFMLVRDHVGYSQELRRLSERVARGRVFFRNPVDPTEVVSTIAHFDLGICVIPPKPVSYRYALPNKFFECIVAGLPVLVGPSPEMERLVRLHSIGLVAEGCEPRTLATILNELRPEDINRMKENALRAARRLNADIEMGKLMQIYERLLV